LKFDKRCSFNFVVFSLFWWDIGFDKFEVLLDGFIHHLLADDVVEEHIELDDHALERVVLV
jgi:hypothetical protein